MCDHNFVVDDMAEGQHAEELGKDIVSFHIVLLLHFSLKSIHLVQLLRFVVSSAHKEVLRETNFPSKHSDDYFNREGASINEIAIEQVWILFGRQSV